MILVIDWFLFLDRCRTTINVWGDSVGAEVIERDQKRQEPQLPPEEENQSSSVVSSTP